MYPTQTKESMREFLLSRHWGAVAVCPCSYSSSLKCVYSLLKTPVASVGKVVCSSEVPERWRLSRGELRAGQQFSSRAWARRR